MLFEWMLTKGMQGCAGDLGWPMTIDLCQSEPDFSNWFEFNYTAYR
jgi:hypothetical protein